jgi:hypothetical protein
MFGQNKFVDLVENGHMEEEQAEDWSCFWVHEWRTNDVQTSGFANIVEDPTDPENHCAHVFVRTEAEADEAGTKVTPDGQTSLASWDSQFFIYVRQNIESGKILKLTMRVRADKACHIETQAHFEPGNYNHYQLFGNIDVTEEWTKIEKEAIISTDMTKENDGKEMHTVAFNLSTMTDGNNFYFDDIKLEIKDQVENEFTGWLNMLRNTDLTSETINDKVVNGYSYYTGRDAALNQDLPARIVIDPVDGQPAFNVTSLEAVEGTKTTTVEDPETGEVTEIEEPSGVFYQHVERLNNDTGEMEWKDEEITDWSTQFFVSQPHQFQMNQKVRFVMWARADKPAQIDSQIHRAPGDYIHYVFLGSFDLTEEWQKFEVETTINATEQVGGWTVAFNCNKLRDANNYYFRFEEFSINEADATDADRTIGQESIIFPVAANDEPQTVMVDLTEAMKTLGINNLKTMITSDKIMKALNEEEVFMEEGLNPVYDGIILNQKGIYDDAGTINIEVDDKESADNKAAFVITNTGEALEAPFDSKLCFEKDGWYYVFNIRFVDAKDYDELMGITEITPRAKNDGAIYDLSGRRVNNVTKGIYIKNGKTFVK